MSNETNLVQTKSNFVIRGIITGKDVPATNNGLKVGTIETGKNAGKKYRSIKFSIFTSKNNIIPIELFGTEKDKAYFWDSKTKKTITVDWNKRNVKPNNDNIKPIITEYDLVDKIDKEFKDGDAVVVVGELRCESFKNNQGESVNATKYIIKKFYASDTKIDFNDKDYKEENKFSQEVVINTVEEDVANKRIHIYGYAINYGGVIVPVSLELDAKSSNPAFAKTIKSMQFGDFVKFNGKIVKSVVEAVEDGAWGQQVIEDKANYLEILGADKESFEKSKYKESDFDLSEDLPNDEIDAILAECEVTGALELPFPLD